MAKLIAKTHAEKISALVSGIFHAERVIRTHRAIQHEDSKKRVEESIEDSKQLRRTLHEDYGILWHHEGE